MSHFDNLVNFYNDLMKNIFDDSSEFYINLNEQQKVDQKTQGKPNTYKFDFDKRQINWSSCFRTRTHSG